MNEQSKASVPRWFRAVAIVSLVWNIIGCVVFLAEVFAQEAMMESMTVEQREWSRCIPTWIYFVFAVSVSTGVAGSICLLLRKRVSVTLFTLSAVAVVIQMGYTMVVARGWQVMGPSGAVMPAMVVTLAIVWLLFSLSSKRKGWLASKT